MAVVLARLDTFSLLSCNLEPPQFPIPTTSPSHAYPLPQKRPTIPVTTSTQSTRHNHHPSGKTLHIIRRSNPFHTSCYQTIHRSRTTLTRYNHLMASQTPKHSTFSKHMASQSNGELIFLNLTVLILVNGRIYARNSSTFTIHQNTSRCTR